MRKKILIVEDDRELLNIYKIRLEQAGFQVFTAQNGATGITKALENTPDLILLDLMMPEADGKDFLSIFQISKVIKNTPIIIVSNVSPDHSNIQDFKDNVVDYLVKVEYTPKEIAAKVIDFFTEKK
jgi:two-component system alkaline phosphatase synthesis response regulator PhoP